MLLITAFIHTSQLAFPPTGNRECHAFWVILDYGDIVAHVFQTPYRAFYRLEDLWADAEKTVYADED